MTPAASAAVTILVLASAGAPLVLLLVGPKVVALPMMPLAGAVLGALAAICTIMISGTLLAWFVAWSVAAALCSVVIFVRQKERWRRRHPFARRGAHPLALTGAIAVAAAVAWTLRTLRVHNIGFDTRAIWLLHARWLTHGHAFAYAAVRNPFLVLSHPGYPPLISAVMALSWQITGNSADRVAIIVVALLNACALFVAAWGIIEAARRGVPRTKWRHRRQLLVIGASIVLAVLAVLLTGGVLGPFFTNGYADPLWALAAVGAVVYGLMLPPGTSGLGASVLLIAVAGLTKIEGTAVAMIIVAVLTARLVAYGRHRLLLIGAGMTGLAALLFWPVATLVLNVPADPSLTGSRQGWLFDRAHRTLSAGAPHLEVVLLAAGCAIAGSFVLRGMRGRLGLGNDLWAWVALLGAVAVLGGAYVFGPGNVVLWLDTSVDRTTIFVALLSWWMVALWAVCGAGVAVTMREAA